MFLKRLKLTFTLVIIISTALLIFFWYKDYKFDNSPISDEIKKQVYLKQKELQVLAYKNFNITNKFPIVITNEIPSKIYGMAAIDKFGKIIIYLNKKRFKENRKYMINDVIPHEYAHAVMFALGDFTRKYGGHTKKWQVICKKLNGLRCERFVDRNDILIEKTFL